METFLVDTKNEALYIILDIYTSRPLLYKTREHVKKDCWFASLLSTT